jgi:hypothetical protein
VRSHRLSAALLLVAAATLAVPAVAEIECRRNWQGETCVASSSGSTSAYLPLEGRIPLLQRFDVRFSDAARPVRRIEIGAVDDRSFRFVLEDRNGGEHVSAEARFVDFAPTRDQWREICGLTPGTPILTIQTTSASGCRGSCVLPETENPHVGACRWARMLTGFSYRFTEPRARKLRKVAIELNDDGRLEATFKNDGDRQVFDVDVGISYLPVPAPPTSGERALHRVIQAGNTSRVSEEPFRGGGRIELERRWGPTWWQDRFIRAFSVRRTHDDGNLRRFAIDVQEEPVTVRFEDSDGREDVTFGVLLSELAYRIE